MILAIRNRAGEVNAFANPFMLHAVFVSEIFFAEFACKLTIIQHVHEIIVKLLGFRCFSATRTFYGLKIR